MSAERLQRLVALAREHDPSLYGWLAVGVAEYLDGKPLEAALGMVGARRRARDLRLREAAALLKAGSRWGRAERLAEVVERALDYGIVTTRAERLVVEASQFADVPRSTRQLYRLLD